MFGKNDGKVNGKQVGVLVPQAQRAGADAGGVDKYAPKNKVTNALPCGMLLVRYGDSDGMAHQVCLLKVGEGTGARYYMTPGAEEWTKALRPLAPWLEKELAGQDAQQAATVPEDACSIDASVFPPGA